MWTGGAVAIYLPDISGRYIPLPSRRSRPFTARSAARPASGRTSRLSLGNRLSPVRQPLLGDWVQLRLEHQASQYHHKPGANESIENRAAHRKQHSYPIRQGKMASDHPLEVARRQREDQLRRANQRDRQPDGPHALDALRNQVRRRAPSLREQWHCKGITGIENVHNDENHPYHWPYPSSGQIDPTTVAYKHLNRNNSNDHEQANNKARRKSPSDIAQVKSPR